MFGFDNFIAFLSCPRGLFGRPDIIFSLSGYVTCLVEGKTILKIKLDG